MTELAMLAQEVGVDERTLRRAVNQGTLRASRSTPRRLELSLDERRFVRRSWRLLADLRTALRTERNVRFALLFGSAATGADTPASDVDLVVEMRDASLDRVIDLSAKLTTTTGRRVDVIRLQDAEADPSLLDDIVAHGRVLVDREGLWPRLRRRGAGPRRPGGRQEASRAHAALAGIDRLLAS